MPLSDSPSDIEVRAIGNMVQTKFLVDAQEITLWLPKKAAARYVLQLQMVLRGMNGDDPLPDHAGWGDAAQNSA